MKVYLAGGFTDWRDTVKAQAEGHDYIDPSQHGLEHDASQYTLWDLLMIRSCDLVFCYFTLDNPSGLGLSLECGYAHALGIPIVLVDERPDNSRHGMLRSIASICVTSLNDGIKFLQRISDDLS